MTEVPLSKALNPQLLQLVLEQMAAHCFGGCVRRFCDLLINLHHLFSNGEAFNTQSRSSPTSYAIRAQNRRWIAFDNERDIA